MKNIFDLPAMIAGFYDKPWLVCGSGPTIRKFSDIDTAPYNILCINNSVLITGGCDVLLARDPQAFTVDKIMQHPAALFSQTLVTDYMNRNLVDKKLAEATCFISYACSNEFSPGIPVMPSSSSAPTAFLILGTLGVKHIFSLGLDSSIGRVAELVTSELTQNMDYSHHNDACHHWANAFGMSWTKL